MKVVIFGSTGRTGILLVEKALNNGHEVVAFLRDPAKMSIRHENLHMVQGDVHDRSSVEAAVRGADAVITAITPSRLGMENIISAMQASGVRRLISAAGAGVPIPGDQPQVIHRVIEFFIKNLSRQVYQSGVNQVAVIRASDLDWTIARAPVLTNQPGTGRYQVGALGKDMAMQLPRADFANFMLKQLTDTRYLHAAPVISTTK